MAAMDRFQLDYAARGVAVLEDACPGEAALTARGCFEAADYDHIIQTRRKYFQQSMPMGPELPGATEVYSADFWRSRYLESGELMRDLCATHIAPLVQSVAGTGTLDFELRAYKMEAGGHFRLHIDDYIGEVGFVWYLCRGWKWDWGGLLITVDGANVTATMPRFNQLAIINHGKRRLPHFVSEVASYAQEPRYMLVGFARSQQASQPLVHG
jgi:Rps23 Pro-64 3,4-dihydroxylase Tpa1-like proline 4-hydroxylase